MEEGRRHLIGALEFRGYSAGDTMDEYIIERRGGFAGLTASGKVQADALDAEDRARLDRLLDGGTPMTRDVGADRYTYVVTRKTASGETTREIPESMMPQSVARVVREQI
jgi:hypothetical protein